MTEEMESGPFGDGGLHPGKYNLRLFREALLNGAEVTAEERNSAKSQLMRIILESDNERNVIAAIKTLAVLERTDVARLETVLRAERAQIHQHVHFDQSPVEVIRVDDYYGPSALSVYEGDRPPEAPGAPAPGPNGSKSMEGGGLRPTVGKNGSGASGNGRRPRRRKKPKGGG